MIYIRLHCSRIHARTRCPFHQNVSELRVLSCSPIDPIISKTTIQGLCLKLRNPRGKCNHAFEQARRVSDVTRSASSAMRCIAFPVRIACRAITPSAFFGSHGEAHISAKRVARIQPIVLLERETRQAMGVSPKSLQMLPPK